MAAKKGSRYPECPFRKLDCFAITSTQRCFCLDNTEFTGKECPFYKPEKAVDKYMVIRKFMEEWK